MRLFAERAAAVKPGFAVTAQNAAAVAAVVRRLDGMPLAIELAAARVPAMTPAELARRLERSFDVLAARPAGHAAAPPDAAGHHRLVLRSCSPSPSNGCCAGWRCSPAAATLEAVEAVCGGEGLDPGRGVGSAGEPGGPVAGGGRGARARDPLPAAGDHPPVRRGAPRRGGRDRAVASTARRLLRRASSHQVRHPDPRGRGVLGRAAQRRAGQPARGVVVGDRAPATSTPRFRILAGFAPCEVWSTYPLMLPGEAALDLPGAAEHPGYPLALAVSAVFASNRADVDRAEELCRLALEANAGRSTRTGGSRRPSAPPEPTSRLPPERSPKPPAC